MLNTAAILKTWDGGQTWTQIATVNPACPGQVFALSFADRLHGGAISQCWHAPGVTTTVSLTEDGGWTWRALPLPEEGYRTITRRSTTTIYLSASDRVPRVSCDGGATFQRLPGPPLAGRYASTQSFVVVSDRLWWQVTDEGFVVTTDGGQRWRNATVPQYTWVWGVRPNGDLWYWRDQQCASDYCAGRQLVSRGDQWLLFDFGALPVEAAPTFLDDRHGWLATAGGHWYRTDNGGASWTQLA